MIRRTTIRWGKLVCVPACLALAACASGPPTNAQGGALTAADFGPYPVNHETAFLGYLSRVLKDPSSAQVRTVAGPATYAKTGALFTAPATYGWGTCYMVNSKNSFGAYIGAKWYLAVIRNGSIVNVVAQEGGDIYTDMEISRFCNSAGAPNAGAPAPSPTAAPTSQPLSQSPSSTERVTRESLAALKPGVTTRSESERLFGAPNSVSAMRGGTLLQWLTPSSRAHIAILFGDDPKETMVRVTHTFFQ